MNDGIWRCQVRRTQHLMEGCPFCEYRNQSATLHHVSSRHSQVLTTETTDKIHKDIKYLWMRGEYAATMDYYLFGLQQCLQTSGKTTLNKMSIEYFFIVWNDTNVSIAVQNDVKLSLHCPIIHERKKRIGPAPTSCLINGQMNRMNTFLCSQLF